MKPGYVRHSLTAQVSAAEYRTVERLAEVLDMSKPEVIRLALSLLAIKELSDEKLAVERLPKVSSSSILSDGIPFPTLPTTVTAVTDDSDEDDQ